MSIIKPRTATVVIYQGDDLERMAELRREAQVAERVAAEHRDAAAAGARAAKQAASSARLGDDDDTASSLEAAATEAEASAQAKRDAYDAFVGEAAERAVEIKVQAIGTRRFRDLVLAHPARQVPDGEDGMKVHDEDGFGVNADTFPRALLAYVDPEDPERRSIIEPTLSKRDLDDLLDDDLSDGDFERCWQATFSLNRGVSVDPFSTTYKAVSQT